MNSRFLKKAFALTSACALCVSTGLFGYKAYAANGDLSGRHNSVNVKLEGESNHIIEINENFFGGYAYNQDVNESEIYMPGDTLTKGEAELTNSTSDTIELWLRADTTDVSKYGKESGFLSRIFNEGLFAFVGTPGDDAKTAEVKRRSEALVDLVELTVSYANVSGDGTEQAKSVIYKGKMSGKNESGGTGNMRSEQYGIKLGEFAPGAKGKLYFELSIPSSVDGVIVTEGVSGEDEEAVVKSVSGANGGVAGMVDWIFTAIANDTEPSPTDPEPTDPKPTVPEPADPKPTGSTATTPKPTTVPTMTQEVPKTGDEALPYALAAVACALGAFGMFVAAFRIKDNETEEQ